MRLFGDYWESVAEKHLKASGHKIIKRNFHSRFGEIDIISQSKEVLVFVEVKFRKDDSWFPAEQAVTTSKQKKIIKTAQSFLLKNDKYKNWNCRFDIVSIMGDKSNFEINWIKHAFYPAEYIN